MPKIYMKMKKLNEDISITDPGLAQQYLAVKKQMTDKQSKKDQLSRSISQIDSELNILQKNLLAVETKAMQKQGETASAQQKQDLEQQSKTAAQSNTKPAEQTAGTTNANEGVLTPKEMPMYEDYVEQIISYINEYWRDGESLAYLYDDYIKSQFNNFTDPKDVGNRIIIMESGANESLNESIYDDITTSLENEINKLTNIKNYVEQYDEDNFNKPEIEEEPIEIEPIEVNPDEIEHDEEDETTTYDLVPTKIDPFQLSDDEHLNDETLKTENKPPYVPELIEEDIEDEIEMMDYEDDDQPRDEYVFHVRINPDQPDEIIAKIYKDTPDDFWTIRVVKGDEQPLQSMEFDPRLDKLGIIGHLADIYSEIEIIDPKEYEYLLDDKSKIDTKYYEDLKK